MSRAYIVTRNGGTVTKAPINDNKIPIYANETALDADLANIPDNTLVATKGGHDDVIDQMKDYIRKQNDLSDFENIGTGASLNTQGYNSSSNAFICPYDGEVYFTFYSGKEGGIFSIHIIDSAGTDKNLENGSATAMNTKVFVLQVKKGNKIYSEDRRGIASYARWYKDRDYTGR